MPPRQIDAAEFLGVTAGLLRSEARNCILIGTARKTAAGPPDPDVRFLVVGEREVTGAAVVFDASVVHVSDLVDTAAAQAISDLLAAAAPDIATVHVNRPHHQTVAGRLAAQLKARAESVMSIGIYSLSVTKDPNPGVAGGPRIARPSDRPLLAGWVERFAAEALPHETMRSGQAAEVVDERLNPATSSRLLVWETPDGEIVAMTGHSGDTGTGMRVNLVYTDPEHRGRGYAGALCRAQAELLLDAGYESLYLYTDLANPTSNHIYEQIGYRRVGEAETYRITHR